MAPKADSAEGIILNFVNEIALEFLPEKLVSNLRKHYDSLPLNYAQAGFEMKDVFLHIKLIEQAAVEDNPAIMIQEISDEETNVNGSVLKLTFACNSAISWSVISGALNSSSICYKKLQIFEKKGFTLGTVMLLVEAGQEKMFKTRIENALRLDSKKPNFCFIPFNGLQYLVELGNHDVGTGGISGAHKRDVFPRLLAVAKLDTEFSGLKCLVVLRRICAVMSLQKHLSMKDHPYHKFSTGNWETLEVRPKERGLDTREELLWIDLDGLDKSESLVRSKFQDIRNTNRNSINFPDQPCDSESLQILVKAVPIKQGHKLRFVWPITPGIHNYKEGPSRYLGHLIGHEGEGSLFYILKKLGGLSAGESDCTYEFSFFKVSIDLTDAGQEHFEDIVALLFKCNGPLHDGKGRETVRLMPLT
ncbi:Insulinase family protein [Perilla frutescens var. frutescens]|nr:Insulinase family protein [Perilla frutescens var. frutescens]